MKKFIQVCSLFSLLVLFGAAASVNAQMGFGTEVEIPFAFNIGDRSYESGSYIFKLDKLPSGTATLSIEDTKNDDAQTVFLNGNADAPGSEVKLVFDVIEGRRYLTKVRTPDRTFAVIKVKGNNNKDVSKAGEAAKSGDAASVGGAADSF